jgi:hypothetical protein
MAVIGDRLWTYSRMCFDISYFHDILHPAFDTSQVPQLWDSSLRTYGGAEASGRRISAIAEIEAEKEQEARQKANDKKALADARSQGKEAVRPLRVPQGPLLPDKMTNLLLDGVLGCALYPVFAQV